MIVNNVQISTLDHQPPKGEVPKIKTTTLTYKINRIFWSALGCVTSYNLLEQASTKLLALESLSHGTGPLGYLGINLNGADPSFGGSDMGSSAAFVQGSYLRSSKNYFHVFKDSDYNYACGYLNVKFHSMLSGMATFGVSIQKDYSSLEDLTKVILGTITGLFTPTLKFKFTPEEVLNCKDDCFFENDPDYQFGRDSCAYRTTRSISTGRIGLTGSLLYGIDSKTFERMANNPEKVFEGLLYLGAAGLVAWKTYQYFKSNPQSINTEKTQTSFFENCKKKIRAVAVISCWATLAITTIFLNTL